MFLFLWALDFLEGPFKMMESYTDMCNEEQIICPSIYSEYSSNKRYAYVEARCDVPRN